MTWLWRKGISRRHLKPLSWDLDDTEGPGLQSCGRREESQCDQCILEEPQEGEAAGM